MEERESLERQLVKCFGKELANTIANQLGLTAEQLADNKLPSYESIKYALLAINYNN